MYFYSIFHWNFNNFKFEKQYTGLFHEIYPMLFKSIKIFKFKKQYISHTFRYISILKGTVARDFLPLVFFMNRTHLYPWFMSYNVFEFCFEFAEIFEFEDWLAAVNIAASHHCPLFNMAVSQNSSLNMWRSVKSCRDLI